ncbi:uncharacterized protein LOC133785514 [Humulus lupulus]|uniref:uncharacterized protein LOC133785514 n=1 Tax=Humulus lupulus TaxID=3486 RepID=UPI002B408CF1|nr:uncharacterized protein LOC133785514 [Humulus lupulus]
MMSLFFSGWNYFTGPASEGRILLIWQRQCISVEVLKESDQLLHVYAQEVRSNKKFCVTFVYGRKTIEERRQLWDDLSGLCFPATPWLVAGDFNAVFEATDRVRGYNITAMELVDAQNWRALGLVDEMRTSGSHFTWTNEQAVAVVNWDLISDHCLCIIKSRAALNCGTKPFRFFHMWTDHDNFKETNYTTAKEKYQAAHLSLQNDPHSSELQREERIAGEFFANHARLYDSFLRQKRKVNWLRYGDDNTTYFHACLKQRRASNRITSFVNESGQLVERFEDVVDHFVNHFQKIMGSQSSASVPIQKSCFRFGHRLSLDQQIALIKPFTRKEVEDALFSINAIKSLGPDGYGSGFFKVMWKDLGAEVSEAILDFFERNALPEEINKATITLIPKVDTPTEEEILIAFCFPDRFIKWVMTCLRDATYLILMNGRIQGGFKGKKGLRQGDPISPLLFVLVMEYFTRLLCQSTLSKEFWFHPKCKNLKLVNLCFADDLVIFCKGVSKSVQLIKDCFNEFSLASGLSVNLEKSQVYFGGLSDREAQQLVNKLHFSKGNFPLKYLGVPLRPIKWKAGDCAIIIKKIQLKLHNWSSLHLSFAERDQLINCVLLSIRSFWMSIFILPKSVIKEVDQLCRNFLWGRKDSNSN